jgi:GTP-binding protein EngB required for normal cell division
MIKKCMGCGITLQVTDVNAPGYIPAHKYADSLLCQNCYRLKHYHQFKSQNTYDNQTIINYLNKEKGMVFFLTDLLNINTETIDTFKMLKLPKILLITKIDLLSKNLNFALITKNLQNVYHFTEAIAYVSSKGHTNYHLINNELHKNKLSKAFIVGYTNAGKSSLINTLLGNDNLSISNNLNTTIDYINLKYLDNTIVDCPGFNYLKYYSIDVNYNLQNKLNPISYVMKDNQGISINQNIFITGFMVNNLVCYFDSSVKVKKEYQLAINNFIELTVPDNSDLVIKSLGFIKIFKSCKIKLNQDFADLYEVRTSILGGKNE